MAMDEIGCCNCGVIFGMPAGFLDRRRNDKRLFYCPNGHSQSFQESEADRLRRERDRLAQKIAEKDDQIRDAFARVETAEAETIKERQIVKRLKTRAKAGVCPCCNRQFVALQRHMMSKHPTFDSANVVSMKAKK